MIGLSLIRRPGRIARSGTINSCRRPASTASRRAGCSPTSTKRQIRFRSSKAIRRIPAAADAIAPKGRRTLNQVTDPDRILYPLKRAGKRGEGKWEARRLGRSAGRSRRVEFAKRSSKIVDREIMYHVGRPGEDGFTERILAAWGVDGHNSHTNICSSGAREGYQLWMGLDRPSPDHANAKVILLISAHLESGHYFNPHAQRVIDGKAERRKADRAWIRGCRTRRRMLIIFIAPYPGSEAAILLSIANYLIQNNLYNREFVRRWWNWEEYLAVRVRVRVRVESSEPGIQRQAKVCQASVRRIRGRAQRTLRRIHLRVRGRRNRASTRKRSKRSPNSFPRPAPNCSSHNWRSVTSGVSGGWSVARALFMLNALLGAVATEGGVLSQRLEQVCAEADPHAAPSEDVGRG